MRVSCGQQIKQHGWGREATEMIQNRFLDIHYLKRYGKIPKFMYCTIQYTVVA